MKRAVAVLTARRTLTSPSKAAWRARVRARRNGGSILYGAPAPPLSVPRLHDEIVAFADSMQPSNAQCMQIK